MNKKQKYIVLIVCIVILTFVIFLKVKNIYSPKDSSNQIPIEQTESTISSTIIIDKETLNLKSNQGESLYDILLEEKEKNNFSFSGKEYTGMGFFTTDIGTLHSTSDHYLMYYVNGKEAEVGISSYFPKNGDIIEWKLK